MIKIEHVKFSQVLKENITLRSTIRSPQLNKTVIDSLRKLYTFGPCYNTYDNHTSIYNTCNRRSAVLQQKTVIQHHFQDFNESNGIISPVT